MKDVIKKVQKCRDSTAQMLCEDMYVKDSIGNLTKIHKKEDGEERVRMLDSIIAGLSAIENEAANVELRGAALLRRPA